MSSFSSWGFCAVMPRFFDGWRQSRGTGPMGESCLSGWLVRAPRRLTSWARRSRATRSRSGLACGSSPTTLLAFLSSGCAACGPLWESLDQDARIPIDARLVIVAKGPEQESMTSLRELAPRAREVLMSTAAWGDYAVPASPHFVLVDGGSGQVAGRGTAASWGRSSRWSSRPCPIVALRHGNSSHACAHDQRARRASRAGARRGGHRRGSSEPLPRGQPAGRRR